jgi:hypothetical protein
VTGTQDGVLAICMTIPAMQARAKGLQAAAERLSHELGASR